MTVSTPIDANHPMKLAWDKFKETNEYENALRWAKHEDEDVRAGTLWAAFIAGWAAHENETTNAFQRGEDEPA